MQKFVFFLVAMLLVASVGYMLMKPPNDGTDGPEVFVPSDTTSVHPFKFDTNKFGKSESPPSEPAVATPEISETGPWPAAEVPDLNHHFGRMQLHSKGGHHEFVIRNRGEAPLELVAGKATCQCTEFSVRKSKLEPGEETVVDINWKAETKTPAFSHGGPVYTNDPKMPKIDFIIEGVIDASIDLFPESIWDIGNVYRDKPATMTATIGSKIHSEFELKSLSAETDKVTLNAVPMTPEELGKQGFLIGYNIEVSVSPEIPGGEFRDSITIHPSTEEHPLVIPLKARKFGAIRYLPTAGTLFSPESMLLKWGSFSTQQGRSGKILMLVDQEGMTGPLEIVSVESNPTFLTARLEPVGELSGTTQRYHLIIELPPGKPRVKFTIENPATMKIKTNHPDGEVIDLQMLFSTN
ncbi:MAG: DUF1573 domain-containing protein [Planctomyces sp.]|nr:DUF1573 domain-containing protein [Planctomyces sp.]